MLPSSTRHKLKFGNEKLAKAMQRREKEKQVNLEDHSRPKEPRRLSQPSAGGSTSCPKCFFCGGTADSERGQLHLAQSFRLDQRVRRCANLLEDSLLHAKLQNGDMIAQSAKYHNNCLCRLYKSAANKQLEGNFSAHERKLRGVAFGEVVAFIEESLLTATEEIPIFKLSDLIKLYTSKLSALGVELDTRVHSTRFKNRLLSQFEDMSSYNDKKEVILAFNYDVGEALSVAAEANFDDDGYILARAAHILRRDMLEENSQQFEGDFNESKQELSVSPALLSFVSCVMHGSSETSHQNEHYKQAILTVSQLIKFNTFIRTRKDSSSSYHSKQREPPLPIYLALMIHNKTRDLSTVEKLSKLGLCISKHRLAQLSIAMGNTVIETNEIDDVVLPMKMKLGVFCTASVDNIDVDIKASNTSMHGTAASINQHPTVDQEGCARECIKFSANTSKLMHLPDWYTEVPPYHLPNDTSLPVSKRPSFIEPVQKSVLSRDENWLKDESSKSWSVFHSSSHLSPSHQDTSVMLPILRDDSKCPATIKHLLDILVKSIHYLNPDQSAVIGFDQPLYALAKRIQWYQPNGYGQHKLILMLGALHIEMVMLSCLGDWLQDSGWTTALSNAEVTSTGNESLTSGHDVAKTKYVHQVTAKALYQLLQNTYQRCKQDGCQLDFLDWKRHHELRNPQFKFWSISLKMELDYLLFLRSVRSSNFSLYVESIGNFLPWIFALDHVHYQRWLSIHHYDMEMLRETNPSVFEAFNDHGSFTVSRTGNKFSNMGLDQRHEQLNKDVKGTGGLLGLTEDEDKFRRWQICSPEVARVVSQFEERTVLE